MPKPCSHRPQPVAVPVQIPAVIRGERRGIVRHQRALLRPYGLGQFQQRRLKGITFDIEFGIRPLFEQLREFVHIGGTNVPRIGPRMNGDTVRTRAQGNIRCADNTRNAEGTRVAQQCNLVDVDAEFGHAWYCLHSL